MKRILSLLVFSCVVLFGYSQQHLMFMETAIDGHVDNFQNSMINHGFNVHPQTMEVKNNVRYMIGRFAGRPADLEIIYYKPLKMVYEVDAISHCMDAKDAKASLKGMKDFLKKWYRGAKVRSGKCRGEKSTDFHIYDNLGTEYGIIRLYMTASNRHQGAYDVVACFMDVPNTVKYVGSGY
ncbi:hypothetical protein [Pseudoprevotella muciniphila]|nr:hypothetical protein [Pseudoprevotella muciniphila]